MLSAKIQELLEQIERLSPEQQESIAEALAVEITDLQAPPVTLADLIAELDEDIAQGAIYDLDELEHLS